MVASRGVLLAALLAAAASCGLPSAGGAPVELQQARTPVELGALLDSIAVRKDAEACAARARIFARLGSLDRAGAAMLRAKGDAADVDVLSQAAPEDLKTESGGRLAGHFFERSKEAPGAGSPFLGAAGTLLRKFVLLSVAARFAEYGPRERNGDIQESLADVAEALADLEGTKPEIRREWRLRAKDSSIRSSILRASEDEGEVAPDARKFCEVDLGRHLDEATRSADRGTAEKAARGDPGRILEAYLASLTHFSLARECLVSPSPAQEHALSGMEIVARSVGELMGRSP